ncbi:MAG: hypothetical protein CL624_05745 [Arcobacter sp.]|nr:hypothetical protein [Arcobacter sp.]|tara:strand:+ start:2281 stop:2670 length:390 start_codon:yes stop_codon:yes gene_type:complete
MKGFLYGIGGGFIVGLMLLFFILTDNDKEFLIVKKDKYVFADKNLQEKYDDWEKRYASELKEDKAQLEEEIKIFNMKNENDVKQDEFPCKVVNDFVIAYEVFYYHKVPGIIEKGFVDYCSYSSYNDRDR